VKRTLPCESSQSPSKETEELALMLIGITSIRLVGLPDLGRGRTIAVLHAVGKLEASSYEII
jgi:hypothetical protein